jgi:hypothetical protein
MATLSRPRGLAFTFTFAALACVYGAMLAQGAVHHFYPLLAVPVLALAPLAYLLVFTRRIARQDALGPGHEPVTALLTAVAAPTFAALSNLALALPLVSTKTGRDGDFIGACEVLGLTALAVIVGLGGAITWLDRRPRAWLGPALATAAPLALVASAALVVASLLSPRPAPDGYVASLPVLATVPEPSSGALAVVAILPEPGSGARGGVEPASGARGGVEPGSGAHDGVESASGAHDGVEPASGAHDGVEPASGAHDGVEPGPLTVTRQCVAGTCDAWVSRGPLTSPGRAPDRRGAGPLLVRRDAAHDLWILDASLGRAPLFIDPAATAAFEGATLRRVAVRPRHLPGTLAPPAGWIVLAALGLALGLARLWPRRAARRQLAEILAAEAGTLDAGGFISLDRLGAPVRAPAGAAVPPGPVLVVLEGAGTAGAYRTDAAPPAARILAGTRDALAADAHRAAATCDARALAAVLVSAAPLATAWLLGLR